MTGLPGGPARTLASTSALSITAWCGLAIWLAALAAIVTYSHQRGRISGTRSERLLNDAAETYVALARALAERDPLSAGSGLLDRSAGAAAVEAPRLPFAAIAARAIETIDSLSRTPGAIAAPAGRQADLVQHLRALALRSLQLAGRRLSLDEEMEGLFAVSRSERHDPPVQQIHAQLAALLPGDGTLLARFTRFEQRFNVPAARLPAVFAGAVSACRLNTLAHVALPGEESLSIEFVSGAAWSGFSTYRGNYHSVVQVNTQYPQSVDRLLDLACHEGYPGHHTSSVLREQRMRSGPGWKELSIMPTFTPYSYAAEAAASRAPAVAFDQPARAAIERDQLFPLAGLDPAEAQRYVQVMRLVARLNGSIAAAIERYLTGELDFVDAVWALQGDALMAHPEALLMFVNQYRGYALAYVSGTTTVDRAIRDGATEDELWARVVAPSSEAERGRAVSAAVIERSTQRPLSSQNTNFIQ